MSLTAKPRTRAIAAQGTTIGPTRYALYKQAYSRINEATKQGFFLEAITLVESLVSDRLESRMSYLKRSNFSFKTLEALIKESRKIETDDLLHRLVDKDLDLWRDKRNKALHEMVKIADGDASTWADRVKEITPVSEQGLRILRAIDKRCKHLRKLELDK